MLSPERIYETGSAFRASRTLLTAVELGLFTELGKGPRSLRQLCVALDLSERAAPHLLDALVTLGFLDRDGEGERAFYLNTRESDSFLDRNSPAYVGRPLEMASAQIYARWGEFTAALRTGNDFDAWYEQAAFDWP